MNGQAYVFPLIVLGIPVAHSLVGLAIGQRRDWPGLGLVLGRARGLAEGRAGVHGDLKVGRRREGDGGDGKRRGGDEG